MKEFSNSQKQIQPNDYTYSSYSSTPVFHDLPHAISAVILQEYQKKWDDLFQDCSTDFAKKASKMERDELGLKKASLVYGEISFVSFGVVFLNQIKLKPGGVYYDLGSGTGRSVFAAEMLHDFDKLIGVEILESLHTAAVDVLEKFRASRSDASKKQIDFIRSDFLELDWSDGDMVFANSTCFDEQLMLQLGQKGQHLKEGAYFVTFTKQLKSPYFDLIHSKQYRMSWGIATVHVQRRNPVSAQSEITQEF